MEGDNSRLILGADGNTESFEKGSYQFENIILESNSQLVTSYALNENMGTVTIVCNSITISDSSISSSGQVYFFTIFF